MVDDPREQFEVAVCRHIPAAHDQALVPLAREEEGAARLVPEVVAHRLGEAHGVALDLGVRITKGCCKMFRVETVEAIENAEGMETCLGGIMVPRHLRQ